MRFNKKNWKAVVLCIFAATVFWFFNALNKTYTANINFPISFDYNAASYISTKPLPKHVRINVTGIGWNLLRKSSGVKVPSLVIPLERPSEVRKIVGSTLPALFSNQLDGIEINLVLTDTLYLDVQPKARRWLKVTVDSVEKFIRNGYGVVSQVKIIPDSIFVEGPLSMIVKLTEPTPLLLNRTNIDENFRQDVEVNLPNSYLMRRNPPSVAVAFDVERLIEKIDSIKLELKNVPENVKHFMHRSYIRCVFSVPESVEPQFISDSVRAVLNLKGFRKGQMKIVPDLLGLPPYSHILEIDTVRVKL